MTKSTQNDYNIIALRYVQNVPIYSSSRNSLSITHLRLSSTSKTDDGRSKSDSEISKELDSTDPDAIYSKVKYEERILHDEGTKGHDGIASSPDPYSSLDETESNETIGEKIKKRIGDIFSKR